MAMRKLMYIRMLAGAVTLTALVLAGLGCHARPAKWSELGDPQDEPQVTEDGQPINVKGLHVVPGRGQYVTQLRAVDIVRILRHIGCSNDEVLEIGSDLRNVLADRGAAQIMVGKNVEAVVEVGNNKVIFTSSRGTFEYNLQSGQIGLPNTAPSLSMQSRMGRR
jgi:hypothetical protein